MNPKKILKILVSLMIATIVIGSAFPMALATPSRADIYAVGDGKVIADLRSYFAGRGAQVVGGNVFDPSIAGISDTLIIQGNVYGQMRRTINNYVSAGKLVMAVGDNVQNAFEEFIGAEKSSASHGNSTMRYDIPLIARAIKIYQGTDAIGRMSYFGYLEDSSSLQDTLNSWISTANVDPSTVSAPNVSSSSIQTLSTTGVEPQGVIGIDSDWHWTGYDEQSTGDINPYGKANVRVDYYKLKNSPSSTYQWFLALIKHQQIPGAVLWSNSWMNEEMDAVTYGGYVGQQLFDWDPKAQPGSKTVSYTIGGTFSGDKGSIEASASVSYDIPDVTLKDYSDINTETAHWWHEVQGSCLFGCPAIATQTWTTEPAAIFQLDRSYPPMIYHHTYKNQFRDCSWFHTNVHDLTLDWYTSITPNYAPNNPSQPYGPASGYRYQTYTYSTSTTDPDDNSVRYIFDWGDGTTTTTDWYASGTTAYVSHYWSSLGTFYVKVEVQDWDGAYSGWSTSATMNVYNRAPDQPTAPSGYTSGYVYSLYSYSTSATDPDNDQVRYEFDWNDGTYTTTGYYPSGTPASASHSWSNAGTYNIKVRAQDYYNAYGTWSASLTVTIYDRAPNTPSTPSGPTQGNRFTTYSYTTSATDPDGGQLRYQFDWGDSTTTVTGWYASGATATASHSWSSLATYSVKVRAQDPQGTYSGWSAILAVSITDRAPATPSTPSGPTSGYTYSTYTYSTSTTDPDGDSIRYEFDWGDGTTTVTGYYASGATASASHYWSSTGTKYVKVRAQDSQGAYSGWSASLTVSISSSGGGGGCPYVSVWDGSKYVLDNNLLAASKNLGGADATDYYMLQKTLASNQDGSYSVVLSEDETEHDYLDKIQMIAVDHESDVNVAVSPYGEVLTYTTPYAPVTAIDNTNRNVKNLLSSTDGRYYQGFNGSYITLNFGDLDVSKGAKLVMRADMYYKTSIHVQVQDKQGQWFDVASFIPRTLWATEIVDMSRYLPDARGNLKVRLYFTANHKLDFVGLDTSPQATTNVQEGQLVSATHSVDGDVTSKLLYSDDVSTEMLPGQQISLTFTLPEQTMQVRNYIVVVEGHYYTINA